MKEGMVTFMA